MTTSVKDNRSTKNNPTDDEFDDEDGGLKPKLRSKIPKKVSKQKPPKTNKTSPIFTDEEDEDGSFNSNRKKEPKQKPESKKIKDESKKKRASVILQDFDDEDGSLRKPKDKIKEVKLKRNSILDQFFHGRCLPVETKPIKSKVLSTDEDDDGGPIVKVYDTIKKMIPSQPPLLKTSSIGSEPPSDTTSDNTTQSATPSPSPPTSTDLPLKDQKPEPSNSNPVPTEETTTKPRKLFTNKLHLVRRKSYEEAQNNSAPIVSQRSNDSSKIENEKIQRFINNLVSAISLFNSQQPHADKQLKQSKKRAQTRWYLAYTIIRNPFLREHRKQYLKLQTTTRVLTISDSDGNTQHSIEQNISLVSVVKHEIETPTSKIEVLQQENMNSSITYTQTTHT